MARLNIAGRKLARKVGAESLGINVTGASLLGDFNLFHLGETASLLVAGVALGVILVFAGSGVMFWLSGRNLYDEETLEAIPAVDERVLLPEYVEPEELIGVAAQLNIVPDAAWIEHGQTREASSEVGIAVQRASGRFGRRRSLESRQHIEMPRDRASLAGKTLTALDERGELVRHVASVPLLTRNEHPVLSDPPQPRSTSMGVWMTCIPMGSTSRCLKW